MKKIHAITECLNLRLCGLYALGSEARFLDKDHSV